jgi:hypothetical protein
MSPLRWDVLAVAFVLALPLLALGLRGSLSPQDVVARLPWCLLAGWGAVALLRWAAQPRPTPRQQDPATKEPTAAP